MGSFPSCKRTKPNLKIIHRGLEKKTFKKQRTELLAATTLFPYLNEIIYEYAFTNKGILSFGLNIMSSGKTFESMVWFDGLVWKPILIPPLIPPLSNLTNVGICAIKDHILFLGGEEENLTEMNIKKTPDTKKRLFKYNYSNSTLTRLVDFPIPFFSVMKLANYLSYLFVFSRQNIADTRTQNYTVYRYDISKNIWEIDHRFKYIRTIIKKVFVVDNKLFMDGGKYLYCFDGIRLCVFNTKNLPNYSKPSYFTNFKNQLCYIDYYGKYFDRAGKYHAVNRIFYEVEDMQDNFSNIFKLKEISRESNERLNIMSLSLNWDNDCHIEINSQELIIDFVYNNIRYRIDKCFNFPIYETRRFILLI